MTTQNTICDFFFFFRTVPFSAVKLQRSASCLSTTACTAAASLAFSVFFGRVYTRDTLYAAGAEEELE